MGAINNDDAGTPLGTTCSLGKELSLAQRTLRRLKEAAERGENRECVRGAPAKARARNDTTER